MARNVPTTASATPVLRRGVIQARVASPMARPATSANQACAEYTRIDKAIQTAPSASATAIMYNTASTVRRPVDHIDSTRMRGFRDNGLHGVHRDRKAPIIPVCSSPPLDLSGHDPHVDGRQWARRDAPCPTFPPSIFSHSIFFTGTP